MDGEAGWWTTSGNIGLPPLARVMGVGRQQHFLSYPMLKIAHKYSHIFDHLQKRPEFVGQTMI